MSHTENEQASQSSSVIHKLSDQIVLVGPRKGGKGQYEYIILSNWARYPLIGLVRDTQVFHNRYRQQLEAELEKEGFINDYSG
ncbi:unnamed protein product [Cylicostephanus goldi]|uniref:Lipocalin domain-containing protein n=1 Tax=Cylicostephanus goldi TaxID=71465 RepID=A0A3P7QET6_CYLGO|nr:unnamed protein product [Cylicostephanus goldi]